MTLQFLNPSRHYNAAGHCVRFRGYDTVFEIAFDIEAHALLLIDDDAAANEPSLLRAFDAHREEIEAVARNLYRRSVESPYRLTAAHFAGNGRNSKHS